MRNKLSARENSRMLLISFFNNQFQFSRKMLLFIRKIIKVMSSSRGRDKICGIFQYFFKMIALSAIESNIASVRDDFDRLKLPFHFVSLKIWKNLSQARKIFRFLMNWKSHAPASTCSRSGSISNGRRSCDSISRWRSTSRLRC